MTWSSTIATGWRRRSTASQTFTADTRFNLKRAYAASDYLNGVALNVWGYRAGTPVYFRSFLVDVESPSLLTFDFRGIDRVHFETEGGCASAAVYDHFGGNGFEGYFPDPSYCRGPGDARYAAFAIDNVAFSFAPEPGTLLLLATGLMGLAAVGRRGSSDDDASDP